METVEKEPRRNTRKRFSVIGFALAAGPLAALLAQSIVFALIRMVSPGLLKSPFTVYFGLLSMYIFGFPVFFLIIRKIPILKSPSGTRKLTGKEFAALLAVCVASIYVFNLLGALINLIIGKIIGKGILNPLAEVLSSGNLYALSIITVLLAPIFEEIMFRKMVLDRIRVYGDKFAVFFSALLFGLFHGNLSQFFYAFALGVIFAYVRIKTNTLAYPIIFHMIINFLGSVIPLSILNLIEGGNMGVKTILFLSAYSLALFGIIISGIMIFLKNRKDLEFAPPKSEYYRLGPLAKTINSSFGMVVFYLLTIYQFISIILLY